MGFPVLYNVLLVQFSDFILKTLDTLRRRRAAVVSHARTSFRVQTERVYQHQFATSTPMGSDIPASHPTQCSLSSCKGVSFWKGTVAYWKTTVRDKSVSFPKGTFHKGANVSSNKATWTQEKSTSSPDNGEKCKSNLKAKEYSCQVWV